MLKERIERALDLLIKAAKKELRAQGHYASGKLERSFETKIDESNLALITGEILQEKYGLALDTGVSRGRVNYNPLDLLSWARIIKPGTSQTGLIRFLYNMKRVHLREGIPTRRSFAFSRNGRRAEWTKYAYEDNLDPMEAALDFFGLVQEIVDSSIERFAA
jgi:hypothetical protein